MMRNLLLVGLGGMIGSMVRYLVMIAFRDFSFPYGTLVVNVVGSFIIGVVAALFVKHSISSEVRLFLATGICGGFTTFSAFSLENVQLITENRYGAALGYVVVSFTLGIAAVFAGWMLAK